MQPDLATIRVLKERCLTTVWPDAALDRDIAKAFGRPTRAVTRLLDDTLMFVMLELPGFWTTHGLCWLSGHASVGPDYNGPCGKELRAVWPEDLCHGGFHSDLEPGDGIHRTCYALLVAAFEALEFLRSIQK